MAFYVKVTPVVAKKMGLDDIRNKTADDNYLLWQSDLTGIKGENIRQKAQNVGGVLLSPIMAKCETEGTVSPSRVFTPKDFLEKEGGKK